jgi:hypothetical protein
MGSEATLIWGVLFGAVGLGYCLYGKRQRMAIALVSGVGLMVFPYFVSGLWTTLLVGALLMAAPWFIRL